MVCIYVCDLFLHIVVGSAIKTTTEDCKYTKLDTQFVGSSWQYIPSYGVVVTAQVTEYYPPFTPNKEVKLPDIPPTPPSYMYLLNMCESNKL